MMNETPKNNPIPHNRPTLGMEEEKMAIDVIRSGWLAQGTAVENFENELCNYLGLPSGSAVAVSSGTAALYLALVILDGKEKNIAIPYYCCASLRHATTLAGATLFLVDSRKDSPNINIDTIDSSTDIAIIPHLFGIPQKFPQKTSLKYLIEDCAQSLGARVDGISAGLQGDVSIFSFYATKMITSGGQGGMIVSKDQSLIKELKDYLRFNRRFDHNNRFNFQMTDLQAAIGSAQLRQLPEFIKRREAIYQQYQDANFPLLKADTGTQPVPFRAILQTPKQNEIIQALFKENITATIPLHELELFGSNEHFPNASFWTHNTVSLPIYPTLSDEEVKRIIKTVKEVL